MTVTIDEPLQVVAEGFKFTECPRWHDGQLYFCDMHDNTVYRLGQDGHTEVIVRLNCHAGGFGFEPDGSMLVVAQTEGRVLRVRDGEVEVYSDLSLHARGGLNDMIVSREGRCYVGRFFLMEGPYDEPLFFVDEWGVARETTENLSVANGIVLTEDGKRLIVAESAGCRLAVFDIGQDGMPGNGKTFAQLADGYFPDGICGDDEGGIWVALAQGPGVVRVEEGGLVTHLVPVENGRFAYACALGGAEGETLFICTAGAFDHVALAASGDARIEAVKVPFRRSGIP